MILISVKSVFMDIKHQEETDKGAEKFLIKTKKLHQTYLAHHVKKKPKRPVMKDYPMRSRFYDAVNKYDKELEQYNNLIKDCTMKVEIINTDNAQLNLPIK